MTGTLIPLRSDRDRMSALAVVDVAAVELLREGRAVTLSGARLAAIGTDLQAKRVQLVAVIADLQTRPPSGDIGIDNVNAILCAEVGTGLVYIDLFLKQVESCGTHVE